MISPAHIAPRELRQHVFATFILLAALGCAIPQASAARMTATRYSGVVETIDYNTKTIVFQRGSDGKDFQLHWYWDTTFVADGKHVHADALKPGTTVKVEYHVPLFGRQYISRIEWTSQAIHGDAAAAAGR